MFDASGVLPLSDAGDGSSVWGGSLLSQSDLTGTPDLSGLQQAIADAGRSSQSLLKPEWSDAFDEEGNRLFDEDSRGLAPFGSTLHSSLGLSFSVPVNRSATTDILTGQEDSQPLADFTKIAVAENSPPPPMPDAPEPLLGRFGQVAGQDNVSLELIDANGTKVEFSLEGNGTGEVRGDDGFEQIELTGTDASSRLTITTRQGTGETTIGNLHVAGDLQRIQASSIDLEGDLSVAGSLGSLVLDDVVGSQSTLSIGSSDEHPVATELRLDEVSDLTLVAESAIDKILLTRWQDTDGTTDSLTAPRLRRLEVQGNSRQGICSGQE
ncbi:MAG: hypothetical protein AAFY15_04885 [Cyanobacteria bacterium J06648_11]